MNSIKKNILDLRFNKYLQLYNTHIIIFYTYLIGIFVALVTQQLKYSDLNTMLLVAAVSFFILIYSIFSISVSKKKMESILIKIFQLEK